MRSFPRVELMRLKFFFLNFTSNTSFGPRRLVHEGIPPFFLYNAQDLLVRVRVRVEAQAAKHGPSFGEL